MDQTFQTKLAIAIINEKRLMMRAQSEVVIQRSHSKALSSNRLIASERDGFGSG